MNYQGWALFLDCDQLMLGDISDLWRLRDEKYAVQVAKHDYQPQEEKKFMGAGAQIHYAVPTRVICFQALKVWFEQTNQVE